MWRDKVMYFNLFQLLLCKYIGNNVQTSNFKVPKEIVMLM